MQSATITVIMDAMKKNTKVACLGAAVQDVFLLGSVLKAHRDVRTHDYVEQFPLGAKLELDRVVFSTGGGATNAAVTFARHGFDSSFLGKVGDDPAGQHVLRELGNEHVKTEHTRCDLEGTTGYSTLLLAPGGERTVLVYRGLSQELAATDFDNFKDLKADWLYISSLAGNLPLLEAALEYAQAQGVKVAFNPGSGELRQADRLRKLLDDIDILSVNKEEAQLLFEGETPSDLAVHAAQNYTLTAVVTDGPEGSSASDGSYVYTAGMYKDVSVLDRTGAGDAFTSGFVAGLIDTGSVEHALIFGSANSTSVVQSIGAKTGILEKSVTLEEMHIEKINT